MSGRTQRIARRLERACLRVRGALLRRRAQLGQALGAPRAKQIVVCGYPRSGTSLLYNMLSASLEGFAFGRFEVPCLERIGEPGHCASKRPLDVFEVEKLPARNVHAKALFAVVVIRDLRDVLTSIHPRLPHDYFIDYDASYAIGSELPHGSQRVHPGIEAYYDRIERIGTLPEITRVIVRYEDLIDEPDGVQRHLAEALGVRFARRFGEFHQHPELHAYRYAGAERPVDDSLVRENDPIDPSRRGKWREPAHRQRILSQFRAHPALFEMLRAYGYEHDDTWFEALETQGGRELAEAACGDAPRRV